MDKNDHKTTPQPNTREAKLAEALRSNLRRRKASAANAASNSAPSKPQDTV